MDPYPPYIVGRLSGFFIGGIPLPPLPGMFFGSSGSFGIMGSLGYIIIGRLSGFFIGGRPFPPLPGIGGYSGSSTGSTIFGSVGLAGIFF